ncbi:MAG: diadenylate cyclase CdaA [Oscillospiraceae bacterium]
MQSLQNFWYDFTSVIKSADIRDVLDILIVSYFLYKGIRMVRETRAQQLVKGIILLAAAFFLTGPELLRLNSVHYILQNIFDIGIIVLAIVFQPELRRALEKVGRTKFSNLTVFSSTDPTDANNRWRRSIDVLCDALPSLAKRKIGALIVIEKDIKLGEEIKTGTLLHAVPSVELIGNIFFPNSPMHDGAVIIRDGIILAAGCFLPKPQNEDHIPKELGSRHRAAIGMSENADSIVIVVSEETGKISVAQNGDLARDFNSEMLRALLMHELVREKDAASSEKRNFFGRVKNK